MKAKIFGLSMLALMIVSLFAVGALALDTPKQVKINGDLAENGMNIERSETIDIDVQLKDKANITDARLEAEIEGYELSEIRDVTSQFDLKAGQIYTKSLSLALPADLEEGSYTLRLTLKNKDSETSE